MTERYSHLSAQELKRAVSVLEDYAEEIEKSGEIVETQEIVPLTLAKENV